MCLNSLAKQFEICYSINSSTPITCKVNFLFSFKDLSPSILISLSKDNYFHRFVSLNTYNFEQGQLLSPNVSNQFLIKNVS
jgi:hypothetical protein